MRHPLAQLHRTISRKAFLPVFAFLFFLIAAVAPAVSPARAEVPAPSTVQAATGKDAKGNPLPTPANPSSSTESFRPALTIPIPDVSLTKYTTRVEAGKTYIDIPWLAQYVNGVYKYAVGFAGLLATIMFMVGGFQYLTAGGDATRVSAGKKRITDAIVGMMLVFCTALILRSINPELINPPVISVQQVKGVPFEYIPNVTERPGVAERGGPQSDYKPSLGKGGEQEVIDGYKKAAAELKVDGCVALAQGTHESGLRLKSWGGIQNGIPQPQNGCFGPGAVDILNLVSCINSRAKYNEAAFRKRFPDKWPDASLPCAEQKAAVIKLLIGDAEVSTYISTYILKQSGVSPGYEMYGLAAYGAGPGSIMVWRQKNGCRPQPVPFADAAVDVKDAMRRACLPADGAVEVPQNGVSNCGPEDKGYCPNVKFNAKSEFRGTCSNGKECLAMDVTGNIKYDAGIYNQIKAKYDCH